MMILQGFLNVRVCAWARTRTWAQAGAALGAFLGGLTGLTSLGLGGSAIGAGSAAVVAAIGSLGRLAWLDLRDNGLGEALAVPLAAALARLSCLQAVELGSNPLGEAGGRAVAAALGRQCGLESVGLEKTGTPMNVLVGWGRGGVCGECLGAAPPHEGTCI
jgi:hypothetical protein